MAFGFDPSIIGGFKQYTGPDANDTARTLSDLSLRRVQQQHAEATLADLANQRQRAQALQSIYAANANTPDNLASALMGGGFGSEALTVQQDNAQTAQRNAEAQRVALQAAREHAQVLAAPWADVTDDAGVIAAKEASRRLGATQEQLDAIPNDYEHARPWVDMAKRIAIPADKRLENQRNAALDTEAERHHRAEEARPIIANTGTDQRFIIAPGQAPKPLGDPKPPGAGPGGDLTPNQVAQQFNKFAETISPSSTRKMLGQLEMGLVRAENLEKLIKDETGKIVDLNPQNVREAVTAFGQLIQNGGQPAIAQLDHLVPDTMASRWANVKQLILNKPQGAEAQDFLKSMLESAAREKQVALNEQRKLLRQQFANNVDLRKYDRKKFDRMVKATGFDPTKLSDEGDYSEPSPSDRSVGKSAVGPHGATVTQNGHTYSWNPETQAYE